MGCSNTLYITKHLISATILIWTTVVPASVFAAEKYALLVGVSNYPSLPENRQLQGAKNDVLLMRKVLTNNGFSPSKISLLADKVEGASAPTREGILTALNQLRDKSVPGDFVYLHFSGHGSQQPFSNQSAQAQETDGLDEIFLPADIGRWNGKTATVKNAIIDDEFDAAILAIRKKGAFVWAVFDTCHAGTLNRGVRNIDERSREVLPSELGIPSRLLNKMRSSHRGLINAKQEQTHTIERERLEQKLGGFAGFYAAQSDQITTEAKFKIESTYTSHGTFSFALAQILSAKPHLSYRELGQQILNHYASHNRFFPTPLFEGEQLDAQVLDETNIILKDQWPLYRSTDGEWSISRGALHQINKDSLFALVENTDAKVDSSKIHFIVKSISALNTELIPIDSKTHKVIENPSFPSNVFARLIRPGIQKKITISLDKKHTSPTIFSSLKKLSATTDSEIIWIEKSSDKASDFELLSKNRLMCLSVNEKPQTCKAKLAWLPIPSSIDAYAQTLNERAKHLRKVSNLLNIAEQFPEKTSLDKFEIRLFKAKKNSQQQIVLNQSRWTEVNAGDKLIIEMENNTSRSIDASLLFVDSAQNIQAVFPYQHGEINRIEPQGKHKIVLDITSETLGVEKLVAILAEARPHSMMQDFSFLAESTQKNIHRGVVDLLNEQELGVLLDNVIFTNNTEQKNQIKRGGEYNKLTEKGYRQNAIRLFSWIVK